jgi:hypothetical protein
VMSGTLMSGSGPASVSGSINIAAGNAAGTVTITASSAGLANKVFSVAITATDEYGYTSGGS